MSRPRVRWPPLLTLLAGAVPLTWLVAIADGWTVNRLVVWIWTQFRRLGFPITPDDMDVALNTAMLLPFALLAGLAFPRLPWWLWAVAGFALSASVEAIQFNLLRDASLADLITNTAGAFLGAWLSHAVNERLALRAERREVA